MAGQSGPTYLIIGNGIAGVTAAEILRTEDTTASIAVIADDPFPVYYRPALKDYLAGRVREDKLWARSRSFYEDQTIYFHADRVVRIQAGQHTVELKSGRSLGYQRLLLAHGARAVQLECPGSQLAGVTTLRTVADYQNVLEQLPMVRRVVVTGSGTLALETAETLRHRGLLVTHLVRGRTLWSKVLDATASDLVLQQELRGGVEVLQGEEIVEIIGKHDAVSGVVTTSGKQIPCEMVLIAIGIEPNIDFVKASGITCGRGVRVDGQMRASAPDIYAAGDVLETTDRLTGRSQILGQWYPAIQQARAAAYSMLGLLDNTRVFRFSTFYNATFLYGLDFAAVGLTNITSGQGYEEIVADPKPRTYRKVLLKNGIPVGVLSLGDRREVLAFKRAIDHQVSLASITARLCDDSFRLGDWLDKQGVPSAILGVSREGDPATLTSTAKRTKEVSAVAEQPLLEGFLVPFAEFAREYRLGERPLSMTSVLSVGREPGIGLLIDQGGVSRRHAEIRYSAGQYVLRDLGSSNGTFINDVRLQANSSYVLKQKDVIRFGNAVKFTYVQRVLSGFEKRSAGAGTTAGVTLIQPPSQNDVPLGQPALKPDGSLLLPGSSISVPAKVVAAFKKAQALVVVYPAKSAKSKETAPQVFFLQKDQPTTIGRDQGNTIEIPDMAVSRLHSEITPSPEGFYLRDLGSSNGVVVNQTKIDNPYLLAHGDHIALGDWLIYYIDLVTKPVEARVEQPPAPVAIKSKAGSFHPTEKIPIMVVNPSGGGVQERATDKSSSLVLCQVCGRANTRIARFCASCSALLEV